MAMSTPITQLPKQTSAQPTVPTSEEDPMVNDVISEMEHEFSASAPPPPPPPPLPQQYMPPPMTFPLPTPAMQMMKSPRPWLDILVAKRAAMCAIVALVLFYPFEFGFVYEKIPMLAKMQPYERAVRAVLLAVLLYVLMWKLNI